MKVIIDTENEEMCYLHNGKWLKRTGKCKKCGSCCIGCMHLLASNLCGIKKQYGNHFFQCQLGTRPDEKRQIVLDNCNHKFKETTLEECL